MPPIIVNHELPIAETIADRRPDLPVVAPGDHEELLTALSAANVYVCNSSNWDDRYLSALSSGDWVQTTSAGYDPFPIDEFRDRGITLTNASGIHGPIVAEHVFALAFAFSRMLPEFLSKQAERVFGPKEVVSVELTDWADRTMTIYGLGAIGEAIAERAVAFGMDVYGVKRNPADYDGCLASNRVVAPEAFHDVLPETDLLVASVPLNRETRRSIDASVFRTLPDSAIFVNVARGAVADEDALVSALRRGELAGAGLDVFETEPLPATSPLWSMDSVVITPHVGGRSDSLPDRFCSLFLENYDRWRVGDPLRNPVA